MRQNQTSSLSARQREALAHYQVSDAQLRANLPLYCSNLVNIKAKDGSIVPLHLNREQLYVHGKLEEQRAKTGKVRALILKPRQRGISTYIGARFYHRASLNLGQHVHILTHEDKATQNLFGMVKLTHDNMPVDYRPTDTAKNANELVFGGLGSKYSVGTAKNVHGGGRSQTIQLFHGCLSPDTFIITEHGDLRRMGDFQIGDMVRTHTGAIAPISFISRQHKVACQITLKGLGQMPITATAEHRFLTEQGWRELKDIGIGDKLFFPVDSITSTHEGWSFRLPDSVRPQGGGSGETGPDNVVPTYELGRILGLYLAEGCIVKQTKSGEPSGVTFAVHEREADRTDDWLDAIHHLFCSHSTASRLPSKTVTITAYGRSLATFVRNLCGELDSKHLPTGWRNCGPDFVRGLIHGYLSGDGCSSHREYDRRISAPSIRPAITVGMRDALASLGYGWAGIGYHPGRLRYGKKCRPIWTLRLCGIGVDRLCDELGWTMPTRRRNGAYGDVKIIDGYARIPVLDIEDVGEIEVMDFEVDHDDHSYCTVQSATHNSETGFWPQAETHMAGALQAVPNLANTEIILESTGNGVGGEFHRMCQLAQNGDSEFQFIFFPWFWAQDYRLDPSLQPEFEQSKEEIEYAEAYDLDVNQSCWLHFKNIEMGAKPGHVHPLFRQEYPANPIEAFQASDAESFISSELVVRARKAKLDEQATFIVVGADIARGGKDRTRIIGRQGRKIGVDDLPNITMHTRDLMEIADTICLMLKNNKLIRMVFIDITGVGAGVYDRCVQLGYGERVTAINFGGSATEQDKYLNKRAEMHDRLRLWLSDTIPVQIPDDDTYHGHLCAAIMGSGKTRYDAHSRLQIESKDSIKERLGFSPDEADASALTFAQIIVDPLPDKKPNWQKEIQRRGRGGFMAR